MSRERTAVEFGLASMRLPIGGVVRHVSARDARDSQDKRQMPAHVTQHESQRIVDARRLAYDKVADGASRAGVVFHRLDVLLAQRFRREARIWWRNGGGGGDKRVRILRRGCFGDDVVVVIFVGENALDGLALS